MDTLARFYGCAVTNDEPFANVLIATDNNFICFWTRRNNKIFRKFLLCYLPLRVANNYSGFGLQIN